MQPTRHHNVYMDNAACFWTSAVVGRIPVFRSATARREMLRIWDECRTKFGVRILGYVIMPDHIHIVIWAEHVDDVKRFIRLSLSLCAGSIATMAERAANRGDATAAIWLKEFRRRARDGAAVRVWKERGRAFPVTDIEVLRQKIEYMHRNPVRAGLVQSPAEWESSSACWYDDGSGPLAIDEIPV